MKLPQDRAEIINWSKRFEACMNTFKLIHSHMVEHSLDSIELNSVKADNYLHFIENWSKSTLEKLEIERARREVVKKREEMIKAKRQQK